MLPLSRAAELRLKWRGMNKREAAVKLLKENGFMLVLLLGSLGFLAAAIAGTHAPPE